jgi:hypothetical protein
MVILIDSDLAVCSLAHISQSFFETQATPDHGAGITVTGSTVKAPLI